MLGNATAMVAMALTFALMPYSWKYGVAPDTPKTSVVLLSESSKVVLALATMYFNGDIGDILKRWRLVDSVYTAAIPAGFYAFQNLLIQYASANLDPIVFVVLNQTKIFWTALLVVYVLQRHLSARQWAAIVLLFISACLAVSEAEGTGGGSSDGVLSILLASFLSSFGAILSERAYSWSPTRRKYPLLLSAELGFYSSAFLLLPLLLGFDITLELATIRAVGWTAGWSARLVLPVVQSASLGLLVGLVTRTSGSVGKGFGSTCGVVLTALLRPLFVASPLGLRAAASVPLVAASVWLYGSPSREKTK